jgi:hypothetical protein
MKPMVRMVKILLEIPQMENRYLKKVTEKTKQKNNSQKKLIHNK